MYVLNHKVTTSRCDTRRKLKFYAAMQMMQDCSEMWLDSEPGVESYFQKEGMAQLLVFRQVDILRVPDFKEDLRTQTSVYEMKGKFGFRNTHIFDISGRPCYQSWSMGAFVNRATGVLTNIPQEVIDTMHLDEKSEMEYADRHIRFDKTKLREGDLVSIERNDIDYNGHVNNAQYVRMAMELLPLSYEDFVRFRIEYKAPVKYGEQIRSFAMEWEGRYFIVQRSNDRDVCIMEFSR